ncbi:MAG TPA: hypothetical protein VFG86_13730, partial [Chloroflexota bacterium]|nr:hypothetical protein [Chloroflexota bacterium]
MVDELSQQLNRRRFLRVASGIAGSALALPLVQACMPTLPQAASATPAAGGAAKPSAVAVFPTYLPPTNVPKADFSASGPQYDDGFVNYPKNPVKALPTDPPGTGSTVNIMSIQLFPPPTPFAQNRAWQAVNKE